MKTVLAIVSVLILTASANASTRITHNYYGVAPVRTYRVYSAPIYSVPVVTAPVVTAPAPVTEETPQPASVAVPVYTYSAPAVIVRSPVVTKKTKTKHEHHRNGRHETTTKTTTTVR